MTALLTMGPAALTTPQEFAEFTEAWLNNRRLSPNTRTAYRHDALLFVQWCAERDLNPLLAKFTHVNDYGRWMEAQINPRTGKPFAPSTVARRLTGLSSWYGFLVKMEIIGANPAAGADRPFVDRDHSTTVGLTPEEVDLLLAAAADDSLRSYALLCLLADLGIRISEALNIEIGDLGIEQGFRTVRFTGKGGVRHHRRLSPGVGNAMNAYLLERADKAGVDTSELSGLFFVTSTGKGVDRQYVHKLIRRLAKKAGIAQAAMLSAHSLRHAYVTNLLDMGIALQKVQRSVRHKEPRTTIRYKQNKDDLAQDPSYDIWLARARRESMAAA